MMTNTEIKIKALEILTKSLGLVEAERFVALIQQEPFDYTKWRKDLFEDLSIEEISQKAMELRKKNAGPSAGCTKLNPNRWDSTE